MVRALGAALDREGTPSVPKPAQPRMPDVPAPWDQLGTGSRLLCRLLSAKEEDSL